MERVICVPHAKVPIVKFWDPEIQVACDLNVNNSAALENTRLIKTYVQIDKRVRPLAMIIKHWTRRRILNDAGEFSVNLVTRIRILISGSFRGYSKFLHVDLHDFEFPPNKESSGPTMSAQEAPPVFERCQWHKLCVCRRYRVP